MENKITDSPFKSYLSQHNPISEILVILFTYYTSDPLVLLLPYSYPYSDV